MQDYDSELSNFRKTRDFFVGIDSDGCVFDTMEIKHKECFIPNIINAWDLQAVSRFARDAAEFVNLYSQWRGTNRFPALVMVFDLLADWPEVLRRGYQSPQVDSLREWIAAESLLGNPALETRLSQGQDPVLQRALDWSEEVNAAVARIVRNVPPFPNVNDVLQALSGQADTMVVSATPNEALRREWQEHGIEGYVQMICGQEMGKKSQHLSLAAADKYAPEKMLMVGDAPGDFKAAQSVGALFFPICPGAEAQSWKRLLEEGLDRFFSGTYAGEYQQQRVAEFMDLLPSDPPWKLEATPR
jgi:phosphoglycolate phosphatase-like HAD superfamily hydrolase